MLNCPTPQAEAEIQTLVEEFAASYQPGVTVLTGWFRLAAPRIKGLLDANWKWWEIQTVLTRAGMLDGAGKRWMAGVRRWDGSQNTVNSPCA